MGKLYKDTPHKKVDVKLGLGTRSVKLRVKIRNIWNKLNIDFQQCLYLYYKYIGYENFRSFIMHVVHEIKITGK